MTPLHGISYLNIHDGLTCQDWSEVPSPFACPPDKTPPEFSMRQFTFAVAFCLSAITLHAGDWTGFRGPTGQGLAGEKNLPVEWDADKNVVWKTPIPGLGWSSPIILGGRIYVTTAVSAKGIRDPEQSLRALCISEQTGEVLWDKEIFAQKSVDGKTDRVHSKNSQASPTPVTDGRHIYVHFGTRGTAALTLDGDIVWKNQELKYAPVHGNGGSPILAGDLLVMSCDGGDVDFIAALNRQTGQIVWKTDRTITDIPKKFAFGTPLLIEVNGQQQIISQASGFVYSYSLDGEMIWKVNYGGGYSVIPRPVFAHGLVYVSSSYDRPVFYAIDPSGKGDVTTTHVRWTLNRNAPHTPSPLVVGDEVYVVSDRGIATCCDARTGRVHWAERIGGSHSASPLAADGKIYIQAEEGETIILKPGKEFQEIGRNRLEPRTFASYAVSGTSLFIRTEKQLYRISDAN